MEDSKKEILRKKYKYRELLQKGKAKLPPESAKKLIGPDCAYHLYSCTRVKPAAVECKSNEIDKE